MCNRPSAGPDVGGAPWPVPTPAVRRARLRLCRIVQFARRRTRCRTKPHSTRLDLSAVARCGTTAGRESGAANAGNCSGSGTLDARSAAGRAQWTACATGCTATTSWDCRTRSTGLVATAPSSRFQRNRWFAVVRPRGAEWPDRAHYSRSQGFGPHPRSRHSRRRLGRPEWVVCGPSGVSRLTKKRHSTDETGGVPSAALSISAGCGWGVRMSQRCGACSCCRGSGNGYSPVYEAAARHRAFRGNEHATMTHPFSKGRSITRAPPPRPYT